GLPAGVTIGFLAAQSYVISTAIRPLLAGLTAIPLFVLAPAFILWFGIGESMKVALAALSCFPFTAYTVHGAVTSAQGPYYKYLQRNGARTAKLFIHLLLPYTIEAIFLSFRPAAVAALTGAFLGEFVAAQSGIGYYVIYQASRYRIAEVLAGVAVLFVTAAIVEVIGRILIKKRIDLIRLVHL